MNKFIKEQLEKVVVAKIPKFDDNTTQIIIPRHEEKVFDEGKYYILSLDDYICSANSSVYINWNNRTIPPKNIIGMVEKKTVNMILFAGCEFDTSTQKRTNNLCKVWIPVQNIVSSKRVTNVLTYM